MQSTFPHIILHMFDSCINSTLILYELSPLIRLYMEFLIPVFFFFLKLNLIVYFSSSNNMVYCFNSVRDFQAFDTTWNVSFCILNPFWTRCEFQVLFAAYNKNIHSKLWSKFARYSKCSSKFSIWLIYSFWRLCKSTKTKTITTSSNTLWIWWLRYEVD